jgi:hypothetical protein
MARNRANFEISAQDRTKAAFDGVMGRLNGVQSAVGKLGRVLTSMPAMIAGVAGAAGFGMLIRSSMRTADEVGKLSDQLRANTEQLIGLQHAAEQSSRGGADLLNRSLEMMNTRLAQAARGTGPAADEIARLGLNTRELANMRSDEAFRLIADRVKDLGDEADRTNAVINIFGRSNQEIIALLDQGADGLDRYQAEAERLGKTLSRVDAAQIEAANDAFGRLRSVINGVAQRIAVALAPFMQAISDYLVDAATNGINFRDVIMDAMDRASRAASIFGNTVHTLRVVFKGVEVAVRALNAVSLQLWDTLFKGVRGFVNDSIAVINRLITAVNRIPGVAIDALEEMAQGALGAGISRWADSATEGLARTAKELHELAMQPMPGDRVEAFFNQIREGAREAAEAAVSARRGPLGLPEMDDAAGGGAEGSDKALEREREALQRRIDQVEQYLMTEEERLVAAFENRQQIIESAYERELLSKERRDEMLENLEADHQERLTDLHKRALNERDDAEEKSIMARVGILSGGMANMLKKVSGYSRQLFNVEKAASISSAVVNTAQAVTKALSAYPPPTSFAMASAQAAAGGVQIAKIASTSFGGGGGGSTVSAPPAVAEAPAPAQESAASQPTTVVVRLPEGRSRYTRDELEEMAAGLNELAADGVHIGSVSFA